MKYEAKRMGNAGHELVQDALIAEAPLSISINGEPLTVTMQTPGDEKELTRGLLHTEGILRHQHHSFNYSILQYNGLQQISHINVQLDAVEASAISKRSLLSVAACGICGKTELQFAEGNLNTQIAFTVAGIKGMFSQMRLFQLAFDASGGCHAAAAFDANEQLLAVKEDVGRHNAVDKVVGHLLLHSDLKSARYLLVSGRVSYEIIAKAFAAGIPLVAAVSAPSSLAVDFAKELGITLLGFCREQRVTQYA
ncbi:MAG: formate dehydrogenase accessory sulfurtransferase FdhD [Flavobacteriales bacterium]